MMQPAHALRAPRLRAIALALLALCGAQAVFAAAPTISGTPQTVVFVGQPYQFQPTAKDADGNKLTFSIAKRPPWATFSTSTGRLAGTPAAADARSWDNIVISVSDGTSVRSLPAFAILVRTPKNKPPTISGTPATKATVGNAYSFQPTAADPENAKLTFLISNRPAWATFNSGTGKLSGTPATSNVGTFSGIKISVTDGSLKVSLALFDIVVSAASSGTTNTAPKISGTPAKSVAVGTTYTFQPVASDANNDALTFSITNKPAWATFSTSTGKLSGTPTAVNVGTTSNVVISVSDGKASTALPSFSVAVTQIATGSVSLSWTPPLQNTDGSTLTNLAGYRITYGTSASALSQSVQINSAGISQYVIDNLSPGTWYFSIASYTSAGVQSTFSGIASKVIN